MIPPKLWNNADDVVLTWAVGYVMSWLSKCGIFPLENVVHIDSDRFKHVMPEWDGYMNDSPEPELSGTRTHLESCMIQEIARTR